MGASSRSTKVLWLSPSLNHYKQNVLNQLARGYDIDLTVLAGSGREGAGDPAATNSDSVFHYIDLNISKREFGWSRKVRETLGAIVGRYDWVMIPTEKKNLVLCIFLYLLKIRHRRKFRLFSYTHPATRSKPRKIDIRDRVVSRLFFSMCDRVIFYTADAKDFAQRTHLVAPTKAYHTNNTIDTNAVRRSYEFCIPEKGEPTILFIGRLIPSKRLGTCINYYQALRARCAKTMGDLRLTVIGDGPESHLVKELADSNALVRWVGALSDESEISKYMKHASLVFVPGESGLAINHTFCYGRPYFTLTSESHGPEIAYLKNGVNGYVLDGDFEHNLKILEEFLLEQNESIYESAYASGLALTVEAWCTDVSEILRDQRAPT